MFRKFCEKSQKRTKNVLGHNTIAKIPNKVAKFLKENLPSFNKDPATFTGHCFRRTAATWAADDGISLINLKRFGRWKSDDVAQGYIDESVKAKEKSANNVALPDAKKLNENTTSSHINLKRDDILSGVSFSGTFKNCSINLAIEKK